MKKDSFIISHIQQPVSETLFDSLYGAKSSLVTIMNKWTGEEYGPFETVREAREFIETL